MLSKYNKKLILDYVYGNDIEDYSLEQLENDPLFMSDVIKVSKEKAVYLFATDNIKKDYNFTLATINTFSKDYDFIEKVADFYLDNTEDDFSSVLKINILMNNLIKDDDKKLKYSLKAYINYESVLCQLRAVYNEEKNKDIDFKMGFIYIYDMFLDDKMILNYFAKNMIFDIFQKDNTTLKEILYTNFENIEDINKMGIKTFIVEYIKRYDDMLSWYVILNINLIDDIHKKIFYEIKNKEKNNFINLKRKIYIVWQEGEKLYEKYDFLTYSFSSYLDTVIRDLDLEDLYKKYSSDDLYGYCFVDKDNLTFKDKAFIKELTKLVSDLFNSYNINNYRDDYDEKKTCKVININSYSSVKELENK